MSVSPLVTSKIQFQTYTVTAPGTAQQFPSTIIPDGYSTVFKNRLANTGNFYLGDTQANAQDATARKVLESGESVTYAINNLNLIWRDADNSTDRIEVSVLAPA